MVQLCRMRYAYIKSRIRAIPCKSNLQLSYDNRSNRQFYIVKIAYDNRKQESHHVRGFPGKKRTCSRHQCLVSLSSSSVKPYILSQATLQTSTAMLVF